MTLLLITSFVILHTEIPCSFYVASLPRLLSGIAGDAGQVQLLWYVKEGKVLWDERGAIVAKNAIEHVSKPGGRGEVQSDSRRTRIRTYCFIMCTIRKISGCVIVKKGKHICKNFPLCA